MRALRRAWKQRVQGRVDDALHELAVHVLCGTQVQMYPQAATCYEEVLLHQPTSIATHVQVGALHFPA